MIRWRGGTRTRTVVAGAALLVALAGCAAEASPSTATSGSAAPMSSSGLAVSATAPSGPASDGAFAAAMAEPLGTWRSSTQTGSMAFTVPGTMVAGALSLDDTIDTWFPAAPNGSTITVRVLLEYESGLYEVDFDLVGKVSNQELAVRPDEHVPRRRRAWAGRRQRLRPRLHRRIRQ